MSPNPTLAGGDSISTSTQDGSPLLERVVDSDINMSAPSSFLSQSSAPLIQPQTPALQPVASSEASPYEEVQGRTFDSMRFPVPPSSGAIRCAVGAPDIDDTSPEDPNSVFDSNTVLPSTPLVTPLPHPILGCNHPRGKSPFYHSITRSASVITQQNRKSSMAKRWEVWEESESKGVSFERKTEITSYCPESPVPHRFGEMGSELLTCHYPPEPHFGVHWDPDKQQRGRRRAPIPRPSKSKTLFPGLSVTSVGGGTRRSLSPPKLSCIVRPTRTNKFPARPSTIEAFGAAKLWSTSMGLIKKPIRAIFPEFKILVSHLTVLSNGKLEFSKIASEAFHQSVCYTASKETKQDEELDNHIFLGGQPSERKVKNQINTGLYQLRHRNFNYPCNKECIYDGFLNEKPRPSFLVEGVPEDRIGHPMETPISSSIFSKLGFEIQVPQSFVRASDIKRYGGRLIINSTTTDKMLRNATIWIPHNHPILKDFETLSALPSKCPPVDESGNLDVLRNHLIRGRPVWITKTCYQRRTTEVMYDRTAELEDVRTVFYKTGADKFLKMFCEGKKIDCRTARSMRDILAPSQATEPLSDDLDVKKKRCMIKWLRPYHIPTFNVNLLEHKDLLEAEKAFDRLVDQYGLPVDDFEAAWKAESEQHVLDEREHIYGSKLREQTTIEILEKYRCQLAKAEIWSNTSPSEHQQLPFGMPTWDFIASFQGENTRLALTIKGALQAAQAAQAVRWISLKLPNLEPLFRRWEALREDEYKPPERAYEDSCETFQMVARRLNYNVLEMEPISKISLTSFRCSVGNVGKRKGRAAEEEQELSEPVVTEERKEDIMHYFSIATTCNKCQEDSHQSSRGCSGIREIEYRACEHKLHIYSHPNERVHNHTSLDRTFPSATPEFSEYILDGSIFDYDKYNQSVDPAPLRKPIDGLKQIKDCSSALSRNRQGLCDPKHMTPLQNAYWAEIGLIAGFTGNRVKGFMGAVERLMPWHYDERELRDYSNAPKVSDQSFQKIEGLVYMPWEHSHKREPRKIGELPYRKSPLVLTPKLPERLVALQQEKIEKFRKQREQTQDEFRQRVAATYAPAKPSLFKGSTSEAAGLLQQSSPESNWRRLLTKAKAVLRLSKSQTEPESSSHEIPQPTSAGISSKTSVKDWAYHNHNKDISKTSTLVSSVFSQALSVEEISIQNTTAERAAPHYFESSAEASGEVSVSLLDAGQPALTLVGTQSTTSEITPMSSNLFVGAKEAETPPLTPDVQSSETQTPDSPGSSMDPRDAGLGTKPAKSTPETPPAEDSESLI
jgi:hypothetical protein